MYLCMCANICQAQHQGQGINAQIAGFGWALREACLTHCASGRLAQRELQHVFLGLLASVLLLHNTRLLTLDNPPERVAANLP